MTTPYEIMAWEQEHDLITTCGETTLANCPTKNENDWKICPGYICAHANGDNPISCPARIGKEKPPRDMRIASAGDLFGE